MNDKSQMSALRSPGIAPGPETAVAVAMAGARRGSVVSWGAILAGAAGAAALSLILLILGVGLGLSTVSPWSGEGISARTLSVSTIVWITLTQLIAASVGGYLAGRLRTRWASTHPDEVYFRDTAHGFTTWAIATLVTAATLTSVIGGIVSVGATAGAAGAAGAVAAGGAAAAPDTAMTMVAQPVGGANAEARGYFVDMLFRPNPAATDTAALPIAPTDARRAMAEEVGRVIAHDLMSGTLPPDDANYMSGLVAQRTGVSTAEADKRVRDAFTRLQVAAQNTREAAQQAADKARKASAYTALWLFVSLLVGAFCAAWAATFGGRLRDRA